MAVNSMIETRVKLESEKESSKLTTDMDKQARFNELLASYLAFEKEYEEDPMQVHWQWETEAQQELEEARTREVAEELERERENDRERSWVCNVRLRK
jgi:hypothetical protein